MSQQPKMSRITGNSERVVAQLQAQCPDLALMLVGSLAVMGQTGNRQVTLDLHRENPGDEVDITITEDSVTIKRVIHEPEQNTKTDQADKAGDRPKGVPKVAKRKSKARNPRRYGRRPPEKAK